MTELPICERILARETGLAITKARTLIREMCRVGKGVSFGRTPMVFREDVAAFLRDRAKYAHAQDAEAQGPESLRDPDNRRRETEEFLREHNRRGRSKGGRVRREPALRVVEGADVG